ncbi:hypothetical protein BDV18DRAFT_148188 [Aspergillus unguis]
MQRCHALIIWGIDLCSSFDEQLDHLNMVFSSCHIQGRHFIPIRLGSTGSRVQEELKDFDITSLGRNMEGRESIVSRDCRICATVQDELDRGVMSSQYCKM